MSKGGGTTKQVSEPWSQAQPYVLDSLRGAQQVYRNPPQFYPGQTFVGPTPGDMAAWDTRLGYSDSVFGGANAPRFGQATDALSGLLSGGGMGSLAQAGLPGGQDALTRMLSGTPDYAGAQGAIDAANAPILRQLEQEIIPGLNSRATFLNNETGGIKALNKILPDVAERMSLNAGSILNQERLRALQSQETGLGMLGNFLGGASGDQTRGLGLFPSMVGLGETPGLLASQFSEWGRQFPQQALNEDMARWDYQQGQPMDMASWYSQIVNGTAGLGGTSSSRTPTNTGLNALGGAATAGALGSTLGLTGGALGGAAGLGALLAFI
jgi:hypothetical protein